MAAALSFAPSPEIERVAHALARELTDEAEAKQFIGIAEEMEAKAAVLTNAAGSSKPVATGDREGEATVEAAVGRSAVACLRRCAAVAV